MAGIAFWNPTTSSVSHGTAHDAADADDSRLILSTNKEVGHEELFTFPPKMHRMRLV